MPINDEGLNAEATTRANAQLGEVTQDEIAAILNADEGSVAQAIALEAAYTSGAQERMATYLRTTRVNNAGEENWFIVHEGKLEADVSSQIASAEFAANVLLGSDDQYWTEGQDKHYTVSTLDLMWEQYEALSSSAPAIQAEYLENAASLRECLDSIPSTRIALNTGYASLLQFASDNFGTDFSATITEEFPRGEGTRYLNMEPPASIHDERDNKAAVDAMAAGSASVEDTAALDAARASALKPYMIDVVPTDNALLPYPNYPGLWTSDPAGYNTNTRYSPGSSQESFTPGTVRNTTPTTETPADYPIGWATAIASGLSNISRAMAVLEDAPSYETYEERGDNSPYENTVYAIAPLVFRVGTRETVDLGFSRSLGRWKTVSDELGIDQSPEAGFYGILLGASKIGTENLQAAAELFETFDADFAAKITAFAGAYANVVERLAATIGCQVKAFAKDAKTDKEVEDLLTSALNPVTNTGDPVQDAARIYGMNRVISNFRVQNIAETATVIEESTDKRNILFKEQCFLLNYINIFINQKIKEDITLRKKRLPYVASGAYTALGAIPTPAQPANNASLLVSGDAYGFLNKLTLNPKLKRLVNIENSELSLLQPSIRLYKVVYDEFGDDDYQVEMKFDSHFTADDLTNFGADAGARGVGAGIKSFVFSYEGSNPFAIKKSIKANLKIFGSNFREFVRERAGSAIRLDNGARNRRARKYKYVDLALKTGRGDHPGTTVPSGSCGDTIDVNEQNENLADLNFRLRAEVGWAVPSENNMHISAELLAAIESSFVTLNLTPTVHNFDFDESGQVVMNINYLAYIEEFFDNKNFNIFAGAVSQQPSVPGEPLVTLERLRRSMALKEVARKCTDSNTVAEVKEDFKILVAADQRSSLEYLTTSLIAAGEIHYLTMPYEQLRGYLLNNDAAATAAVAALVSAPGSFGASQAALESSITSGLASFETQAGSASDDPEAGEPANDAIAAALLATPQSGETVAYFYLGRLIDIILKNIDDELKALSGTGSPLTAITEHKLPSGTDIPITHKTRSQKKKELEIALANFKRLRIVLGPVEFVNAPSRGSSQVTNATFGDLPISVKYFVEYMTDKMLKKEDTFYSLTKFLNDIMNEFVRDFLNSRECFRNVKNKVRAQQTSLTSWSPSSDYDVLEMKIAQTGYPPANSGNIIDLRNAATIQQALSNAPRRRARIDELQNIRGHQLDPVLNLSGPPGARTMIEPDQEFNYFVYFAGQIQPLDKMRGKRGEDEGRGIFHYMLGRDKGLIKNISLSKTQTRGLAEVRFEQDGYDGLRQLRVVYDVEIDSYANINTYPGTYIYVDPYGFDPGYNIDKISMTELGIGGYYMIIRSEHEFGAGKANTKITAKWVNQIERDGAAAECQSLRDQNSGTNDPTQVSPECEGFATEREEAANGGDDSGSDWWPFWDGIPGI